MSTPGLVDAIRAVLQNVQAMQESLNELRDTAMIALQVATQDGKEKRIDVKWIGQNIPEVATDDYTNSDCGAAALAMLINWLGVQPIATVDDVSLATGKPRGYKSLSFDDLIGAARRWRVTLQHVNYNLDEVCAEVSRGKPVIVLVDYKSLPLYYRSDVSYNGGHWLLVVGYDDRLITYHDSYWRDANHGAFKQLDRDNFKRAYTTPATGNQYACHALRMV